MLIFAVGFHVFIELIASMRGYRQGIIAFFGRVSAMTVVACLLCVLPACRHGKVSHHVDDARYEQLDSSLASITDVDSLAVLARQSHEQNDDMAEMLALKYQGLLLRDQTRFDEAMMVHRRELEIASTLADTIEMSLAFNNMGMVYRRLGDLTNANGYFYESLKLIDSYSGKEDSDEVLRARVAALYGIGNIEIELCNYSIADSVLRESLKGEQQLGNNKGMAVDYAHLGTIKRAIGDNDSAWVYFSQAMEYNRMAGNNVGVALCHMHFGELQTDERRFSHALKEYNEAYDLLKQEDDTWHRMNVCLALARINILLGEKNEARKYLQEVELEAQRMGSKEHQAKAHDIHYELALLEGNHEAALDHFIRSKEMCDSIYGLERFDEMHSQRMDYERNRASGEIDVLNRDISHLKRLHNLQIVFTLFALLMAGAIIAALMYAVRVRARTQRLMRQVEETRSLFFTNVVHQLRTPLSAIMGAIDSIITEERQLAGQHTQQQRENAQLIERQGENLLVLVDRILEVGSVRSALKEPDWRHGDVVTLIRMVLESFRERCVEQHIELTYAPRESNLEVDTVPRYLITILSSLIENAINYSRELGKITVTSHASDNMLVIRVADNGMGISEADLPHVFEPFYRAAAAEQLCEGVGIGLTVVRDMTMALGGIVAADSLKDRGSVFTVKLPCKHGQGGIKGRFDEALEPMRGVVRRLQRDTLPLPEQNDPDKPMVLIVEDHSDVARLVGNVVGKDYQVQYAPDGEQGLALAMELLPDIIITDVKMPAMDGLELCRRIRQSRHLCHIPIIMLSARNSDEDRVRGVEAGADAYLVKPFVPEEMRAWINRLLESRQTLRDVYATPDESQGSPVVTAIDGTSQEDMEFLRRFALEVDKQSLHGGKLDFDKMTVVFKMSESQLRRKLQELTGKNVPAYVTQLRMEKAMRLLREERDMLIGDIADQCGFQDVAYFSRVFRQQYGMTPTQARNRAN
jgi:signal transduction histidine kinase/DNA-binding response OmpR family regulator/Tfp pilus assembly protein PilF